MAYSINETVTQIGKIAFEGNIIPNEWFAHLRNNKGKIQTNAVLILADIVHWFLPLSVFPITMDGLIDHNKKFKDDLLKLDYGYFKNKFGFSEKQTRLALLFLEEKELIFREFRKNRISKDVFNNVMHIGIHPKKIAEISGLPDGPPLPPRPTIEPSLQSQENKKIEPIAKQNTPKKDWALKYSDEQKAFLDYLLNIKPEVGDSIERDHATWWIKEFGIEKIKTALQVYWQQVQKAKLDSTVPMPLHIGRYVRKALNDGTLPIQEKHECHRAVTNLETSLHKRKLKKSTSSQPITFIDSEESAMRMVTNLESSFQKRKLYMKYMNIYEVNEINDKSVTFQRKEIQAASQEESKKEEAEKQKVKKPTSIHQTSHQKKKNLSSDWKASFTVEERKFLAFLLSIVPAKGESIEEKHATWWIRHFGITKIEVALQVYWQQVDKAKKDSKVPMPRSIGAYVREALNKGTQSFSEADQRNKAFVEQFKRRLGLSGLTITEKYCRFEELGKEWYYNMPEEDFQESLRSTFENYCSQFERQICVALKDGIQPIQERLEKSRYDNNDRKSETFHKEIQVESKEDSKKEEAKQKPKEPTPIHQAFHQKNNFCPDGKISFTLEERKFLAFLLSVVPAKGESIEEQHATFWINHFGISKIKVALQVYWQQVEKAKQDSKVSMPANIGAYVREALDKGTQLCREVEHRNKTFAEQFKVQVGCSGLMITEKYCGFEEFGQKLYYILPEEVFKASLRNIFDNYCSLTERHSCVA